MKNVVSFQERVCRTIIACAKIFQDTFLTYDYLVCSDAFSTSFHTITAHEGNYLHLTGVHTNLKAIDFFNKCIKQTLQITDFDFKKPGVSVTSVKGSVREKITVLPYLNNFFSSPLLAIEGFKDNKVLGTFATSDKIITLGFVHRGNPMSLLKGMKLDKNIAKPVELVFRKPKNVDKFSEIILGEINLPKYRPHIASRLSSEINTFTTLRT